MGQKLKTPKGEISITNCEGRIRLRWRYAGERYSLNLPYYFNPENLHFANVKVAEIKLDILRRSFDTSLEKYGYLPTTKPIKAKKDLSEATKQEKLLFLNDLAAKFNEWAKHFRNVDIDNSIDYLYIRKWLEKRIQVPIYSIAERLNSEIWAVTTYNRRLSYLNTFLTWLVDSGIIERNPLKDVCKKREKRKIKCSRRNPLQENEIVSFLDAIKNDTHCPTSSRFKHSHYYPFLAFIFHTGVRNAEAIGLKVKHIDFESSQIEISETFARTIKGTNHASRIEKGTKMQNVRYLPLSTELSILLEPLLENKKSEDFVFVSPKGLTIDDKMLKRRVLKPVMEKLGLGDRDLYAARHSFGTRAVQQGMVLTEVAYLMGHSTVETTMRNYVSVTKPATSLPIISRLG
ncbi:site-specific integrase [Flavisolibacter nicotianae]|uniref:site-specific integrase n=1 Tax=Flavisolibacter nicotianae TaxID=2364882 RepID=UPI000EB5CE60|nr:site-specific integrase [Flavisolibacter nicotianae]